MKPILPFIITVFLSVSVFAQAPDKLSYQAVVRDADNTPVTEQEIGLQISILKGGVTGTEVYAETHKVTSNVYGLVSLEIGSGTVVTGTFGTIDWGDDTYFVKTEVDLTGGTSYNLMGTSQLLSVPYALHAKTAESIAGGGFDDSETNEIQTLSIVSDSVEISDANKIAIADLSLWDKEGDNLSYSAGNIGIGTSTPLSELHLYGSQPVLTVNSTNASSGLRINVIGPDDDEEPLFRVQDQGTTMFSVNKAGKLGVGTPSAIHDLEIVGSSRFSVDTDNGAYVKIGNLFSSGDALRLASLGNVEVNINDNDVGSLKYFRVMNSGVELFRIAETGRVGIGTTAPTHNLQVSHSSFGATNTNFGLKIENNGSNNNSWTLYTYNGTGNLGLFFGTVLKGTFNDATGAYSTASDRKFKQNIEPLGKVLDKTLKLLPSTYEYKTNVGTTSIGFIAQDVLPLFPEFVNEVGEQEGESSLTVNYAGFSVIAIKAIQEQQTIIQDQENRIAALEKEMAAKDAISADLQKRLEAIEAQLGIARR